MKSLPLIDQHALLRTPVMHHTPCSGRIVPRPSPAMLRCSPSHHTQATKPATQGIDKI